VWDHAARIVKPATANAAVRLLRVVAETYCRWSAVQEAGGEREDSHRTFVQAGNLRTAANIIENGAAPGPPRFGYGPDPLWSHDEGRRPPEFIKPETVEQAAALLLAVADGRLRWAEEQGAQTGRKTVSWFFQEAADLRVAANILERGWFRGLRPPTRPAPTQPDSVSQLVVHAKRIGSL
jgi:hypothetical protein